MPNKPLWLAAVLVFVIAWANSAYSEDETVLATNYDLSLKVGDQYHSVQSNALVRSGSEVPIELQTFKIGLRLIQSSPETFSLKLAIYEKSGSGWYQINVPAPEFNGALGAPTEISWVSGEIAVEIALIVGVRSR